MMAIQTTDFLNKLFLGYLIPSETNAYISGQFLHETVAPVHILLFELLHIYLSIEKFFSIGKSNSLSIIQATISNTSAACVCLASVQVHLDEIEIVFLGRGYDHGLARNMISGCNYNGGNWLTSAGGCCPAGNWQGPMLGNWLEPIWMS